MLEELKKYLVPTEIIISPSLQKEEGEKNPPNHLWYIFFNSSYSCLFLLWFGYQRNGKLVNLLCGMGYDSYSMLCSIWFGSLGMLNNSQNLRELGKESPWWWVTKIGLLGWVWNLSARGRRRMKESYILFLTRQESKSAGDFFFVPGMTQCAVSVFYLNWGFCVFTLLLFSHGVSHPSGVCHCLPTNNSYEKVFSSQL